MRKPVVLIGGGGHAKVLIDALRLAGIEMIGFTDPLCLAESIEGVRYLGGDDQIYQYSPDEIHLVNAVGSISISTKRRIIYETFKQRGYIFASVIHPSAIIASSAKLLEGVQIMAGAIIQSGSLISENTIINTRAAVDHDCSIGAHVHIAPGATLSGGITVADGVHIGTGASLIQGITLGTECIVGAGAVVVHDVRANAKVMGVPAREV